MNFTALDTALAKRWNGFLKQLAECRAKPTEDAVHDLRVSIRRLEATLRALNAFSPNIKTKPAIRELKSLLRPFGRVRDAHVQKGWILKLFRRIGPGLNEYLKVLDKVDDNIGKKALETAMKFKPKITEKFISGYMTRNAFEDKTGTTEQFAAEGTRILHELWDRMTAFEPDVFDEKNVSSLHRLRIAVKRYRYTAEIVVPPLTKNHQKPLESLHDYQTLLGEIHDLDVLRDDFLTFAKKKRRTIYEHENLMRSARALKKHRAGMFREFLQAQKSIAGNVNPESLLPGLRHFQQDASAEPSHPAQIKSQPAMRPVAGDTEN